MIKVCLIGLVTITTGSLLRRQNDAIVSIISLTAMVLIGGFILSKVGYIIESIEDITRIAGVNSEYIKILLKMLGITYISEISQDMCMDAGFSLVGNQISIFAKLTILGMSLPIILSLIKTILMLF